MPSLQQLAKRGEVVSRLLASVGVALFTVTALAQWVVPDDIYLTVLFSLAVALVTWSRDPKLLWSIAILGVINAQLDLLLLTHVSNGADWMDLVISRGIAVLAVLAMAGIGHMRIMAERTSRSRSEQIETQNAELAAINSELTRREEKILRQNEELQSQTEELERQRETLRITNDDLAQWERILEQLLMLSRSLMANLARDEMLASICEALVALTEGCPAAIMEKKESELLVSSHKGFGADGPERDAIPFASSFASMVISEGQTAYIEDLDLRPELMLVHPAEGPRFRSVLAAPLRIQGCSVGAIAVYSHRPRVWTEMQIAMIESLAAQASISLQTAEMVAAVQRERKRFAAAFRTVPFGMLVCDDADCRSVRPNPAAAAMLGVATDENIAPTTPAGARVFRSFQSGGQPLPPADHPLQRACRNQEVTGEELTLSAPGGGRLELLASAAPIHGANGAVVGGVCALADVTAQKTLQREIDLRRREAEEASTRKTHFLAAVSHDIRTPANAISLMAELIRRYAADPNMTGQIAGLADDLQRNTLSLIELIGDVLDMARFDSGKSELVESEFALADLVEQELRQHLPAAQKKGLELIADSLPGTLWLRTDRVKLARVLGNLLGNAIKFTTRGSVRVSVEVEHGPDQAVAIQVRDTGCGVPPELLQYIFDEFRQLHNPARDRGQGAGLGLSICKRLVEFLGGTIQVESQLNVGSVFKVLLPASIVIHNSADETAGNGALRAKLSGLLECRLDSLRVLLVEDHASTRNGAAQILRGEGAAVTEAADGATALACLMRDDFDVLLLDMMLPDLDGREVLRHVQDAPPASLQAIFALTGDVTSQRKAEIQASGAHALFAKPIDVEQLIEHLRDFVPDIETDSVSQN